MAAISVLERSLYTLSYEICSPLFPRLTQIEELNVERTLEEFTHQIKTAAPFISIAAKILSTPKPIPPCRIAHALSYYKASRTILQNIVNKIQQLQMDIEWAKNTLVTLDPSIPTKFAPIIAKHARTLRLDAHSPLLAIRDNINLCTKVITAFYMERTGRVAPFFQHLRVRVLFLTGKLMECVNKATPLLATSHRQLALIHSAFQKLSRETGTAIGSTEGVTKGRLREPTGSASLRALTEHRRATAPLRITCYSAGEHPTHPWADLSPAAAAAASVGICYRSTLESPLFAAAAGGAGGAAGRAIPRPLTTPARARVARVWIHRGPPPGGVPNLVTTLVVDGGGSSWGPFPREEGMRRLAPPEAETYSTISEV